MSARRSASRLAHLRPWVALLLPALAWIVYEYGAGSSLRGGCGMIGAWLGPMWGGGALALCVAAALLARAPAGRADGPGPPPRAWLARVALGCAGVFALAITLQLIATLIVPSCAR